MLMTNTPFLPVFNLQNSADNLRDMAERERLRSHISYKQRDRRFLGFADAYLRKVSLDKIDEQRARLMEICQYAQCAAKFAAIYIYQDTQDVFNRNLKTKQMYEWLKEEFHINATLDNFYKQRPLYDLNRR